MTFLLFWAAMVVVTMVIADRKRLSIVGYFLFALVCGPLALVVVLLAAPRVQNANGQGPAALDDIRHFTIKDAGEHLTQIKKQISYLNNKVVLLETRINELSAEGPKIPAEEENVLLKDDDKQGIKGAGIKETPRSHTEGFEVVFGKYWLNRIGVVLFVVGVGLFISYTFQYLSAWAKVGIGYLFSAGFFVLGNYLENKSRYQKAAFGILGGAWGLLYLSTFAMHYIEATRVIANPFLEIFLLTIVSGMAVYHNLKYESWIVTALTFLLAFITAGLGEMNYSSIGYFSLLAGSIAFLACRRDWHQILILGIIGSYVAHLYRMSTVVWTMKGNCIDIDQFKIVFGVLFFSWVIYSLALFILKLKDEEDHKYVRTGILLNAGFFTLIGLYEINRVDRAILPQGMDERFLFLTFLAVVYFVFAYLFKRRGQPKLVVMNCLIALTLVAMAIFIKVPDLSVSFFWILEMNLLFILGLYYKERLYRICAALMSALVLARLWTVDFYSGATYEIAGMTWRHSLLVGCFTAVCFYALGAMVNNKNIRKDLRDDEYQLYFWLYPVFATGLLTVLFEGEIGGRWLSLSWTLLGAGALTLGFILKNRVFRICALCLLSLACLRVVFVDLSGVNTIYKITAFIVLGAILLGVSLIYSKSNRETS